MIFSKPVTALTYSDIEGLTSGGEAESVILDYKGAIEGKDRDKAGLAKDVTALANSDGGHIIIGVEEKKGKPVHPPTGVDRMLGSQKVEEWIDQVVASNISPRVPVTIQPIDHGTDPDRCLIVIHVPVSPRAPHMVTAKGDNRYYKRQQFHSLPAEEYEVRELFYRSTRMRDEVQALLKSRGFGRLDVSPYGGNEFTQRLSSRLDHERVRATNFVVLTSCPEVLSPRKIPVADDHFWAWMSPHERKYPPADLFVPHESKRTVSQGALFLAGEMNVDLWRVYLYVHDTGYVEMGLSATWSWKDLMAFTLTTIVARYAQFLRFVADLYRRYSILWPAQIAVHLSGAGNAVLCDLGEGWRDPFDKINPVHYRCLEHNVVHGTATEPTALSDDVIDEHMRQIASDIGCSFGTREQIAFSSPHVDANQSLDVRKVHTY